MIGARRGGMVYLDMVLTNKAMTSMTDFAIQLNKNTFGLAPAAPLSVPAPVAPNQSREVSLPLNTSGPVQMMNPLNNLQVGRIVLFRVENWVQVI